MRARIFCALDMHPHLVREYCTRTLGALIAHADCVHLVPDVHAHIIRLSIHALEVLERRCAPATHIGFIVSHHCISAACGPPRCRYHVVRGGVGIDMILGAVTMMESSEPHVGVQ